MTTTMDSMERHEENVPVVNSPFNLQTYQRRLRHLQSIAVRTLSCPQDPNLDFCSLQVFFTLHENEKSKAFFTSEKITGSLNPTWQSFDLHNLNHEIDLTSKSVIVRVWLCQNEVNKVKIECHVWLNGLVFFADKIGGIKHPANTFLFGLHNHYYVYYNASLPSPHLEQHISDKEVPKGNIPAVVNVDQSHIRLSYNLSSLARIHTVKRAIKQTSAGVNRIYSNIEDKLLTSTECTEKLSQREMLEMKVRQLKQELLWQTQQKQLEEDKLERLKEEYEIKWQKLKKDCSNLSPRGNQCEENRTLHIQSREMLVKENAQVQYRRKQIISEMAQYIYPISQDDKHNYSIVKVKLPNAEDYQNQDEARIAVGLGFTCHLTIMLSNFMDMPLRYPMKYRGSRSVIFDHVHSKLAEKDREFPLFRSKEKFQFNYAVFLLNKNISQLRFYCGLATQDLRQTLPNLKSFLEQKLGIRPMGSLDYKGLPSSASVKGSKSSRNSLNLSSQDSSSRRKKDYDNSGAPSSAQSSIRGDENSTIGDVMTDTGVSDSSKIHPFHSQTSDSILPQHVLKVQNKFQAIKNSGSNGYREDSDGEDLFKPSNDNFFQVTISSEASAFRNSVASATLPIDVNVVIPTSDNLTDNDQRTFKLIRSPALPVTNSRPSGKSLNSSTDDENMSRNDTGSSCQFADVNNSYNQSYSSLESSVTSSDFKHGLSVLENQGLVASVEKMSID